MTPPPLRILHVTPNLWYRDTPGLGMPVFYWNTLGYARLGAACKLLLYGDSERVENAEGCAVHRFTVPGRKWGPAWHEHVDGMRWLEYVLPLAGRLMWRGLFTRAVLAAFRRAEDDFAGTDIVVGHMEWSAPAACRIARRLGVPFTLRVYGAHDLGRHRHDPRLALKHLDLARAWRLPAAAIVVTDDGAYTPAIASALGVDPGRVHAQVNGVDKQPGEAGRMRRLLGLSAGRPIIYTLCRHSPPKRLDLVLEAALPLASHPSRPALVLAGDGSGTEALKARAAALGFEENDSIFFPGMLDRRQVRDLAADGDILVSCYEDANFSNHLWESMVGGACPVVTHHGEGHRFLSDGEDGVLLHEGRDEPAASLAARIRRELAVLLDAPARLERLQTGAAARAATFRSWEERTAWELDLLQGIVRRNDRRGTKAA